MHVNQVCVTENRRIERWEEKPSDWKIKDIGAKRFDDWLKQMTESGYMYEGCGQDLQLLSNRFLTRDGYLKNSAVVFFVDSDLCEVQLAVYEDCTKKRVLESQRVHGTLLSVIKATEHFIEDRVVEYPKQAIHALLVNAFCHRDFTSTQYNEVLIFENRIEIFNPGGFPEGYNLEDFVSKGQRPVPTNPMIARILYYMGYTEGMGTGLRDVIELCNQSESDIRINFQLDKGGVVVELSGGKRKSVQGDADNFSKNERMIMAYLKEHDSVTNAAAREIVHIGTTATRGLLNGLVDRGYLRAEGENRGRRYYLENTGK